jgi:hypothetical protein
MTNKKSFLRAQVQLWEQIPEEPFILVHFLAHQPQPKVAPVYNAAATLP